MSRRLGERGIHDTNGTGRYGYGVKSYRNTVSGVPEKPLIRYI